MLNKGRIIFWGTPEFALPSLQALHKMNLIQAVVTQPDKPAGRGKKLLPSPVKQYCLDNNIDTLEPIKLDQAFIDGLKKYLPATFVVVAYGKIIPQEVLDLSELAAINIHPSQLPELRGPSPIQTALLRGFESTAVSLMQLDEKMDHGPILGQIEVKIEPNEDYIELAGRLSELGAQILSDKINDYLTEQITPLPQDDDKATFCKMIKKQDGQIDWSKTAQEIHNQVRAFRQWPTAFTSLGDIDLKIIQTQVVDRNLQAKEVFLEKDQMFIGAGDKAVEILQIQPAGKKVLKIADFVRGYSKNFK
ncbi:methionyl-tRNA formyltransferase [Candidatus Parcubacteria bacterium]|jgi:methionyl-tRNA formyltransferase|nr:methionyl-tRNA formyltransferase [Candidatus Parcubacteria bacterium]